MAKLKKYYAPSERVGHLSYDDALYTEVYRNHLENPKWPEFEKVCQLKNTNSWVVRDTANGTICCQSYRTIVAMKAGDTSIDFGTWSQATTRHQGLFRDWCRENPEAV